MEELTPVYPPSHDLEERIPFVTTLSSQRKALSAIDDERGSGSISCWEQPHPLRPLQRGNDSTDRSFSSRGSRKQPLPDSFGLKDDRNADSFPRRFVRDFSTGDQEHMGGIARFKTRRAAETVLIHPPTCDLAEQIPFDTTLPSQRETLSGINYGHLSSEPLCSPEKRGRQAPALRFFNNGIEVDINGRRIVDTKEMSETKDDLSCNVDGKEPEPLIRKFLVKSILE